MKQTLDTALACITSATDPAQLKELEAIVTSIMPSECTEQDFNALLQVFERFPEHDGFDVFWSLSIFWKYAKAMNLHLFNLCSVSL